MLAPMRSTGPRPSTRSSGRRWRALVAAAAALACALVGPSELGASPPPPAKPKAGARTELHLMTMGPGAHMYTRGGHASLMVTRYDASGAKRTTVYNYGDTDWKNPYIARDFILGQLKFFLSVSGTVDQTLAIYGLRQNRTIYLQKLNLSPAQVDRVVRRLEREVKPENREYPYHHIERICTTRIRDLLDDVLGGAIEAQLDHLPEPLTIRDHRRQRSVGFFWASLAANLLIGRMHDRPISRYYALFVPKQMRAYFQQVKIADPAHPGREVPLASKPIVLRQRFGPPVLRGTDRTTSFAFGVLLVAMLLLGALAYRKLPQDSRPAGAWMLVYAVPAGLIGVAIVGLMLFSGVPEFRKNELILLFWPTDLLLVSVGIRWLRRRPFAGKWLRAYVLLHVAGAAVKLGGQAVGALYQQPVMIAIYGSACAAGALLLVRRVPASAPVGTPATAAHPDAPPATRSGSAI